MATTLRKLTGNMLKLHRLATAGEIDEQTMKDTLEGMKGDIEKKAEGLLSVDRQLESESDQLDQEIKRLQAMKKVRDNGRAHLRDYLRLNMELGGIDKISCPFYTITLRAASKVAEITDLSLLPSEFVAVTLDESPKKKEILDALKKGKDIPGARLVDGKRAVLIK